MLCLLSPEDRVPKDHPLRGIKKLADAALAEMSPLFDEMYSDAARVLSRRLCIQPLANGPAPGGGSLSPDR